MTNADSTEPFTISSGTNTLVFYCRSGYEKDAADEVSALSAEHEMFGYPSFKPNQGYFLYQFYSEDHAIQFATKIKTDDLIFTRQYFLNIATLANLPKTDRVGAVTEALRVTNADLSSVLKKLSAFGSVSVDYPDTESGKEVAKFAKKFTVPLRQALRNLSLVSPKESFAKPMLHVFLIDFSQCFIGISMPTCRSQYHNGIHRLKFPSDAPSRSTLKLEEALIDLVPQSQRNDFLREGARAVDLGACPGGWTYQLVKHQVYVEAVDNGAMDEALMRTGLVNYAAADGFKYKPQFGTVDLVVCDMIEKPDRVAELITQWLIKPYAKAAVFNLKLPMKQRFETVQGLLQKMQNQLQQDSEVTFIIRCKHLYHNRDEVTVSALPR